MPRAYTYAKKLSRKSRTYEDEQYLILICIFRGDYFKIEAKSNKVKAIQVIPHQLVTKAIQSKIKIEDGTIIGGLASKVEELIFENQLDVNLEKFAYPDEFIKHGSTNEIEEKYGLDVGSIVECLNSQENSFMQIQQVLKR